jgi:hypothetical protein
VNLVNLPAMQPTVKERHAKLDDLREQLGAVDEK